MKDALTPLPGEARVVQLETRVKHLTNDLKLTREEYDASMQRYYEIYATLEQKVAERTVELARANEELQREVIERRRAQMQLQQTQKMKAIGTLAGGIAHDFNNILAAILGYTEMAMMDMDAASETHRRLGKVVSACQRAKDLVMQILTFSRQNEVEARPVSPLPVVKETLKLLRSTLPATIAMRVDLPSRLPMILADPSQINQVLMNLCTNAQNAMREAGGSLEVALAAVDLGEAEAETGESLLPGRYLRLTVTDTGCGMSPEVLEQVFDPYFSTQPKCDGAGLGLAVVHGIVHQHGGAIRIRSAPGEGTAVMVLLPVIDSDEPAVAPEGGPVPGGRETVLLVEDEHPLAEVGSQMLERLGYTVAVRTSSVEALEAFRANPHRFDLVITDQTMPNMTGLDLTREILAIRPNLPVILCTGFSETVGPEQAMAMGVGEFLFKPIALREMAETIRRALTRGAIDTAGGRA